MCEKKFFFGRWTDGGDCGALEKKTKQLSRFFSTEVCVMKLITQKEEEGAGGWTSKKKKKNGGGNDVNR